MKIQAIDIYGYGKWVQQRFNLEETLQIFYGRNEAGKSTIQSFIRSILFGFPDRRKRKQQVNRYEPKQGDQYGGRLLLTDTKAGNIWVERTLKGLKVTKESGQELPPETLDDVLSGLDETLFDTFYSFSLQNLQELANVGAENLNDYFLSIGTTGSETFLSIAKELEKESNQMYRKQAQTRPINQMLVEYDTLAKQVDATKENMTRYRQLLSAQEIEETNIQAIEKEIATLNTKRQALDQLNQRYMLYLKQEAARRELAPLTYTDISSEQIELLQEQLRVIERTNQEVQQLEERLAHLEEDLKQLTRFNWAKNHIEDRKIWLDETGEIKVVQSNIEQKEQQIQEAHNTLEQLALKGKFYPEKVLRGEAYAEQLDEGLRIQSEIDTCTSKVSELQSERNVYIEQRKEQQNNGAIARQQIANLESQRVNDEEQLVQLTSLNHYLAPLLAIVIGGALNFFANNDAAGSQILTYLGIFLIIAGLASGAYVFYRHRTYVNAFQGNPAQDKIESLRQQEAAYQEQSRALGLEINERLAQIEELDAQISQLKAEQKEWLGALGFYPDADPEIVLKTDPVANYDDTMQRLSAYEADLAALQEKVSQWRLLIQPLLDRFPTTQEETRPLIRYIEETEASLAQSQQRGQQILERSSQVKERITKLTAEQENAQKLNQEILQASQSRDVAEFTDKVAVNQRIDELKQEINVYQEQIQGHEEALANVESKQALEASLQDVISHIQTLQETLGVHLNERANLNVEIHQLEKDGTYQQLSQQLAIKGEELSEAIEAWAVKRTASYMIYQTLRRGIDDPLPQMNDIANKLFESLSLGRYKQIRINKSGIKVKQFSDILFEPHELSQGTLEQLYVSLRLAFILSAKDMVSMPIIIDDAFVNFDEVRKQRIYDILEEIADNQQILFFTLDSDVAERFTKHSIHLEEIKQIETPVAVDD